MPLAKNTKRVGLGELGISGLNFSVRTGTVDEELLPQLQGKQAIRVYRDMSENDAVVGAILFVIDMLIRQVEWHVELGPDGRDEDKEFLEQCMLDMSHSWSDFMSEIMSMIVYGFSFFEIVYKMRSGPQVGDGASSLFNDGKVGWRKFAIRSQDSLHRWDMSENGGIKAFVQRAAPSYNEVTIPMEKGLLFRTSTFKNNPEGRSVLRTVYRAWFFKKRIEETEGVGIERDLAGMPFAEVPAEWLADDAPANEKKLVDSILTMMKNVRRDRQEGIIWPRIVDDNGNDLAKFSLLTSGGSRNFDTSSIIDRYDRRITMAVLADFIMLGHQNVGSFALSSDKTDLFAVAVGAWLNAIADVINRFAVARLFEINGLPVDTAPKIVPGDLEKPDLAAISTFLGTMAGIGMPLFPDEELENYVREIANLPEPSQEAQDAAKEKQDVERQQLLQMAMGGDQGQQDPYAQPQAA